MTSGGLYALPHCPTRAHPTNKQVEKNRRTSGGLDAFPIVPPRIPLILLFLFLLDNLRSPGVQG